MRVPSLRRLVAPAASLLLAVTLVGALPSGPTAVAAAPDPLGPLFEPLPDFRLPAADEARVRPTDFTAFAVDLAGLRGRLASAPTSGEARRGAAPSVVFVPDPEGRLVRFAVTRTPTMEPALAAAHPELRTYAGRGLDDPGLSVALDVTPMGFHASVRQAGAHESWLVDPVRNERGTVEHVSYHGEDSADPVEPFDFRPPLPGPGAGERERALPRPAAGDPVPLRTYRLALVTDPSYATYFGTANVLAEKVTLMNRVNQVYTDDLAIRMLLVDGTDRLNLDTAAKATGADGPCGANPCYTADELAGCSGGLLTRNRFVLGQLIGADRYDIGHIALGLNGGGIAGLGVVGESRKAAGCTGLPRPQGDFFAIDYVAHEMGHQFNGNHTFDGNQANCSLTNRNQATAVEPGSGSSVMAYAGICGRDDLQPHTDPYFSQRSLDEVDEHVTASPLTYDEVQTITLRGFDTAADVVRLTYPGREPVTIVQGSSDDTVVGVRRKVRALTGYAPNVTGYDDAEILDGSGFTLSFGPLSGASGVDVARIGVETAGGDVTGFTGVQVQGGPGTNQGASSATGNRAPAVTAPADRSLPVRTPFTLTGSGTDADGDPLVFVWEQNDEGAGATEGTALTSNAKTSGPLFRVFGTAADVSDEAALLSPSPGQNSAGRSPSRTFPDLAQILAGNTNAATGACPPPPADVAAPVPAEVVECYSEFLPTAGYTGDPLLGGGGELNFRLTGRDQRPGGGGTGHDDVRLTLVTSAGPFLLTSQAARGVARQAGTTEAITWAVNGTAAPGLAPQVRITLSEDGGQTFPHVLAASTANDGTETITWPAVSSDRVRIRVEAVDNYFFDVNDADLSITTPLVVEVGTSGTAAAFSDDLDGPVTVTARSSRLDADQLEVLVTGVPGLRVVDRALTPDGQRPSVARYTLGGPVQADPGTYDATVTVREQQAGGIADADTVRVAVRPEGAELGWTGPTRVGSGAAARGLVLTASVADVADGSPGDVRRSRLTFVDRADGTTLCEAPVVGTAASATAACEATLADTTVVGLVLTGSHARDDRADDAVVTVAPDDTRAPQTAIVSGPAERGLVAATSVRFRSTADEEGATYRCVLDGRVVPCPTGQATLRGLVAGQHTFSVAARDAAGNLDRSPVVRRFAVAFDDRQLLRSGPWRQRSVAGAFRGTVLSVARPGAQLALDVRRARRVGIVVSTAPGSGTVVVRLGGRVLGRVSLAGPARTSVLRVLPTLSQPLSGRLSVRTTSGAPVRVDGIAVFRG